MPIPVAPIIRKQLLEALEQEMLPAARARRAPTMILAQLPIQLPAKIKVTHLPIPLLEETSDSEVGPFVHKWPQLRLDSTVCPYLGFVLEGAADLRIGTTRAMAQNLPSPQRDSEWVRRGCHVLQVSAPAFLFFPPGVPRSDGAGPHWERPASQSADSTIFWLHVWRSGVRCHLCTTRHNVHTHQRSIIVNDTLLVKIVGLLQDELSQRSLHHAAVARGLLLALLLRLHRRLTLDRPVVANSEWATPSNIMLEKGLDYHAPVPSILAEADKFIHAHLHEAISVARLARHCGLSPSQLNRSFRVALDISIKGYIDQKKIEAGKRMLANTEMQVKEVSRLLGYAQVSQFSHLFHRLANMPPSRYRAQMRDR